MVTSTKKDETKPGDTPEVSPDSETPTQGEPLSQDTDVTAPVDTTDTDDKPKRLSPVERLAKQLEEAKQAAAAKAGKQLGKAQDELDKATVDLARAQVRHDKAVLEVNRLSAEAGGIDPIVAADTARRQAEAEQDTES